MKTSQKHYAKTNRFRQPIRVTRRVREDMVAQLLYQATRCDYAARKGGYHVLASDKPYDIRPIRDFEWFLVEVYFLQLCGLLRYQEVARIKRTAISKTKVLPEFQQPLEADARLCREKAAARAKRFGVDRAYCEFWELTRGPDLVWWKHQRRSAA